MTTHFQILFALLFHGWTSCQAKVTYVALSNSPGLYLEEVGTASITSNDWKIVLYYDLEGYWKEWEQLKSLVILLQEGCENWQEGDKNPHRAEWSSENHWPCDTLVQALKADLASIKDQNPILQDVPRKRRAPLEFVGTFMSDVFGVMDQRDALRYEAAIKDLQRGAMHLNELTQRQTHVLDVTTNLMKRQWKAITVQHEHLQKEISTLAKREDFIEIYLQTAAEVRRFQEAQSDLIEVMVDLQQGQLNPHLITPRQLQSQMKQLESWMVPGNRIPSYDHHWVQLYRNLKITGRLIRQHLLFELKVPLLGPEVFHVIRAHPVPATRGQRMMSIQPVSPIIMMNAERTWYYHMDEREFGNCVVWDGDEYLCRPTQGRYNADADNIPCEIRLLKQDQLEWKQCDTQSTGTRTSIQPLKAVNTWILAVPNNETARAICNASVDAILIQGSGVLTMTPDCKLLGRDFIVSSQKTWVTTGTRQAVPSFNISTGHIMFPEVRTPNEINDEMNELVNSIEELKYEQPWYTWNMHDLSHYTTTGITIVVIILVLCWYWRRRRWGQLWARVRNDPSTVPATKQRGRRASC